MFALEMKDIYEATTAVRGCANKGIHPGTQVTRTILDRLGSPDKKLKIIHIAGTNGKGSTAEFFTQILISAGKKTGTFTSPQVVNYYDQFRIDGKCISPDIIEKYFKSAVEAAQGTDATEFEIQTAGIIYAFYKEGCEYAVIECGMGGLNDATNAISEKVLAVITSISLEHTAYLGDTLEKICVQKAGIIKNCPVVVNAHQPDEVKKYFENSGIALCDCDISGFEISANGCLQPYNAATAVEGARILKIDESAIRAGIKTALPYGRLTEIEAKGRTYILDGAHNPAAFKPLSEFLKGYESSDVTVIFGCLSDKDADGNLKNLKGLAEKIIAVECSGTRAMPLCTIKLACERYFKNVASAKSVSRALETADTQTVVVCGSFTLLGEAREWIENSPEDKKSEVISLIK